jgi:Thermophilic metalloprotease (M29)
MLDDKAWEGVNSLISNYAKVQANDIVIIVYTSDSREPAAWVSVALKERGIVARLVWMSPLHDDKFLERITSHLPLPTELSGRLVVLTLERDTMSHDRVFSSVLSKYEKNQYILIRSISACHALFANALSVLPEELSAHNATILKRCVSSKSLRIQTSNGTELKITLDNNRYRWINNRGISRPGGLIMLPAGEVATFPSSIEGVLVADFALNFNTITDLDVSLENNPVTVWIEHGQAVKYKCKNIEISRFLDKCFQQHCFARNVGELGFGTNFGINSAIPMNSHINERRPGVHIGFGQHNQHSSVVNYDCNVHLDLIAKGGLVWIDDEPMPIDLENVPPSLELDPTFYHDQDIYSADSQSKILENGNCCGEVAKKGDFTTLIGIASLD